MRTIGGFWAALLIIAAAPALARTYSVGVQDLDYLPHFATVDRQLVGFVRDLLDSFAKDEGIVFEYSAIPISRLHNDFPAGKYDFCYPDNPRWSTATKSKVTIIYSDAVERLTDGIMLLPERQGLKLENIRTFGLVQGFTRDKIDQYTSQDKIEFIENPTVDGLIGQVLDQRIDVMYANILVVQHRLDKMNRVGSLVYSTTLPHTDYEYYLSTVRYPEIIDSFNVWMKSHARLIAETKKRYGIDP
jgi:hypothetical protein